MNLKKENLYIVTQNNVNKEQCSLYITKCEDKDIIRVLCKIENEILIFGNTDGSIEFELKRKQDKLTNTINSGAFITKNRIIDVCNLKRCLILKIDILDVHCT